MPRLAVRKLIYEEVMASRPEFEPIPGRMPYTFQRVNHEGGETFYETIGLSSSQKYHVFDAAVAWGLFPTWNGTLARHALRAASGLAYLCGRLEMRELLYEYDGSESGARRALRKISRELTETGQPWMRARTVEALASPLVESGLQWVRSHRQGLTQSADSVREALRDELSAILRRRAYELDLGIAAKREIRRLSFDLLEFATDVEYLGPTSTSLRLA